MNRIPFSPGLIYMVIAAIAFSLMGLFIRLLPGIPFIEVVFFRALVSLILASAMLVYLKKPFIGHQPRLLLLRGLFGFGGLSAYFFTIQNLPLAQAVTVQYTNPLFTALWAPFFLKEKWRGLEWLAALLCFSGVILIADPGAAMRWFPALIGLAGACCSGLAYNTVRLLGLRGENPHTIVFYFPLIALLLCSLPTYWYWKNPDLMQLLLLLGVGICTQVGQVFLTKGLREERAARATVVNYLVLFLSAIYSYFLLNEKLGIWSLLGMMLVIFGITVLSFQGRFLHVRAKAN